MSTAWVMPGSSAGRSPGSPAGPSLGSSARRSPGRRFLAVFAVSFLVAVAEVALLILIGRWLGAPLTIALLLVTSILGLWVLRRQGPRSWRAFREDLRSGRPPGASATDGLLVLVGGVLLVTPGFLTDLFGALLVLPFTRRLARGGVQAMLTRRLSPSAATTLFGPRTVRVRTGTPTPPSPPTATAGGSAGGSAGPGEAIEGEIIDGPAR